ncbi:Kinesin-like protein KIN12A [Apostasia shenzhenica]|uniref:Kinesin-like protein KIN12A n=1 Tax=Apostasia shenzhenica TaxID=1088818 RepID=A0A2I0AFL8_9ASPA|nr:Kinesin-like protein KIN12A [Apostasia shenzhenica]
MGLQVDDAFIQVEEHRPKPSISVAGGIPVIDLSPLLANPIPDERDQPLPAALLGLVAELGKAFKDWGFFQVVNHGVPAVLLDRVYSAARDFFALPSEEKLRVRRGQENPVGYYDTEHTKNVRDWKEVFDFTANEPLRIDTTADSGEILTDLFWNQWPANPPDFRKACEEHTKALENLAFQLLELMSLSLGLPAKHLNDFFKEHTSFSRLNFYPPCPTPDLALGVGRHKDPGALTILAQDDVGGLDVKRKTDGEWVRVKPIPNAYIINLGDITQVWSNDEYESVEHRVSVNSERERFSFPFFFNPARETIIRPLNELTSEQNPAKYEAYNWDQFLKARNASNFKKLQIYFRISRLQILFFNSSLRMLRDLRFFRRNYGKDHPADGNNENLPADLENSSALQLEQDPTRPPLHTIQEPAHEETLWTRKHEKTPNKSQVRGPDALFQFRTPEKVAAAKHRFGSAPKIEQHRPTCPAANGEDSIHRGALQLLPPPPPPPGGKASSVHSGTSSAQSTPTKSVSKPTFNGFTSSRAPGHGGTTRAMNLAFGLKGAPMSSVPPHVYAPAETPHFELKENPSFWMEHNVQVVIRVRPINTVERNLHGNSRCVKQESAQSITWIGQPEAHFMFDYVACETVNQEMLFRVAGLPVIENCISGYNSCVFAYGQTGTGKTYTMLGEINDLQIRPSTHRGMTPRIFEFLFARIKAEEESRRDEKLQYSCRCSFLEIYNEQITDLLDPSSTNLLIREDLRKGVYVENLTEFEVESVNDILKLLIQGAANRKVAATNMNRESSRSHCVFTCTIESRWEKDSSINLRFARLNLVDLAGSERQKLSGAEGDRLKEAANINKSLSTLGHVIMILADVANGRQKHVPYRDSKLTFLLQDSLGGNSKTVIIANVSPSICSANETLSTLKFAQRAKLIQNNAVVNEDASGEVVALQHQIQLLKEELSFLKRQNISRSLSFRATALEDTDYDAFSSQKLPGSQTNFNQLHDNEASCSVRVSTKKLKSLETTLAGALRREKMADTAVKQLEAEILQLNRLVRQREENTQGSKMMIKFREDKIHRMEALLNGLVTPDSYLLEENNGLSEEIKLLQAKVDRNPEVTRFALENIRLLEQLRKFQDFYEEGERDLLLAEVCELRNQLLQVLDGKSQQEKDPKSDLDVQATKCIQCSDIISDDESLRTEIRRVSLELEDCRSKLKSCLEINRKLTRETNNLNTELKNIKAVNLNRKNAETQDTLRKDFCFTLPKEDSHSYIMANAEEILNMELELDILKIIIGEERSSRIEVEERAIQAGGELSEAKEQLLHFSKSYDEIIDELKDARSVIEALESQHVLSINELEELRENNIRLTDVTKKQEQEIYTLRKQLASNFDGGHNQAVVHETIRDDFPESRKSPLQEKLKKVQISLDKALKLNMRYQTDQVSQTSNEREMDEIRRQAEIETVEVIVCLQEELEALHQQVDVSNKNELVAKELLMRLESKNKEQDDKLHQLSIENKKLTEVAEEKEQNLKFILEDWQQLSFEIADLLENGNADLDKASYEVASISDTFSQRSWIAERFGKIIQDISERNSLIEKLQKNLEDAYNVRHDMEWKLRSLRGAMLAISEAQQQESVENENKILHLTSLLSEKSSIISELKSKVEDAEERFRKAEICATVAFITVNRFSDASEVQLQAVNEAESQLRELKKHAMLAISEAQQQESVEKVNEILHLTSLLSEKSSIISELKSKVEDAEERFRKAEICATVAFITVNRFSDASEVQLQAVNEAESQLRELKKHAMLQEQISLHADSKERLRDLEVLNLDNHWTNEEESVTPLSTADDLIEAKMKLEDFQMKINNLQCCINRYSEKGSNTVEATRPNEQTLENQANIQASQYDITSVQNNSKNVPCRVQNLMGKSPNNSECRYLAENEPEREKTIVILRREIESALESVTKVQSQMVKLIDEKDEFKKSVSASRDSIKCLTAEVLRLNLDILNKEKVFEFKLLELDQKLKNIQGNAMAYNCFWRKEKEWLEHEICDLKSVAAEKTIEASDLLIKIEEVQETMQEADVTVNALLEANETAKFEIERLRKNEISLKHENSCLESTLHNLQASLHEKDEKLECTQKSYQSNLMEAIDLASTVEDEFVKLKDSISEKFDFIKSNVNDLKSEMLRHLEHARVWLEESCLDIIGKDCALSVLHICHIGYLLERITGLNAENCLLQCGLSESNSLISNLKDHNMKVKKELQMCSILRGKLLSDINNSFVRITKKEEETSELSSRLNLLEKRISGLQLIEETMLDRSNSFTADLDVLKEELDANKEIAFRFVQEKITKENEELKKQLEDTLVLLNEVWVSNGTLREELEKESKEKIEVKERLENEVSDLNILLIQKNHLLEDLGNIKYEKLEMAQSHLEEKEAVSAGPRLENLFMENEELKLQLINKSKMLEEVKCMNEVLGNNLSKVLNENAGSVERLEKELFDVSILLEQRNHHIMELHKDISKITDQRNHVQSKYEKNEALAKASQEELFTENEHLKLQMERLSRMLDELQSINQGLQEDLGDKVNTIEMLEKELLDLNNILCSRSHPFREFQKKLTETTNLKEKLESEVSILKEKLEMTEAVATEARQIAEERKVYAQEREKEVMLLERSIKELECTIEELIDLNNLLGNRSLLLMELQKEMAEITNLKEKLESELSILKEKLEMTEALAEENEAIAIEARQIAEERKVFAQEREDEVMLLERSVEELECTINALQEQVRIVKEEAERQGLQRNELEMDHEAMRHSENTCYATGTGFDDLSRNLKKKAAELEEAQQNIRLLEKEVVEKKGEIAECKSHISELNLHAEAQAREYKLKFKELEVLALKVKSEEISVGSTKSEKCTGKSRGSGSPFKCIGLGLAQQVNAEKDEELTASRRQIEELEALVASQQKQVLHFLCF